MDITLFNNGSMVNTIEKKLTNSFNVSNVFLKDDVTISTPIIIFEMFSSWNSYNYCYIPLFNRYYFIIGYNILDGNRIEVNLRCDVLMSFKTDILKSVGEIKRSTTNNNSALSDTVTPPWVGGKYTFKRFSGSEFTAVTADNYSFVLVTIGG